MPDDNDDSTIIGVVKQFDQEKGRGFAERLGPGRRIRAFFGFSNCRVTEGTPNGPVFTKSRGSTEGLAVGVKIVMRVVSTVNGKRAEVWGFPPDSSSNVPRQRRGRAGEIHSRRPRRRTPDDTARKPGGASTPVSPPQPTPSPAPAPVAVPPELASSGDHGDEVTILEATGTVDEFWVTKGWGRATVRLIGSSEDLKVRIDMANCRQTDGAALTQEAETATPRPRRRERSRIVARLLPPSEPGSEYTVLAWGYAAGTSARRPA